MECECCGFEKSDDELHIFEFNSDLLCRDCLEYAEKLEKKYTENK